MRSKETFWLLRQKRHEIPQPNSGNFFFLKQTSSDIDCLNPKTAIQFITLGSYPWAWCQYQICRRAVSTNFTCYFSPSHILTYRHQAEATPIGDKHSCALKNFLKDPPSYRIFGIPLKQEVMRPWWYEEGHHLKNCFPLQSYQRYHKCQNDYWDVNLWSTEQNKSIE